MKPLSLPLELTRISANARFVLATLALGLLMTGPFVLTVTVVYLDMPESERHDVLRLVAPHWLTGGLLTFLGFVAGLVLLHKLFRSYVKGLAQMAQQLQIMNESNRDFRVAVTGPLEVQGLAAAANQLADQRDHLLADVQNQVQAAREAVASERSCLAVLLAQLPVGVVVVNPAGRVVLYNPKAREGRLGGNPKIGLGRSIYSVLSEPALAQAQAQLLEQVIQGEAEPSLQLALPGAVEGEVYEVQLAPISMASADEAQGLDITGYVLMFMHQEPVNFAETPSPSAPLVPASVLNATPRAWHHRPEFYDFDLFQNLEASPSLALLQQQDLGRLGFTVFDTETTGLNPSVDQIIQIGAVRIVNRRLLTAEIFNQLIDPGCPISPASMAIHGIHEAQLKGQPRIDEVLPEFHFFCGDTVLVAHNAAFDLRFLQLREDKSGVRFLQPVLDTLLLSAWLHPEQDNHALEAIAARLGVQAEGRHDAVQDALITGQVFLKLLPLLRQRGIHTLAQALQASQKTRYARVQY